MSLEESQNQPQLAMANDNPNHYDPRALIINPPSGQNLISQPKDNFQPQRQMVDFNYSQLNRIPVQQMVGANNYNSNLQMPMPQMAAAGLSSHQNDQQQQIQGQNIAHGQPMLVQQPQHLMQYPVPPQLQQQFSVPKMAQMEALQRQQQELFMQQQQINQAQYHQMQMNFNQQQSLNPNQLQNLNDMQNYQHINLPPQVMLQQPGLQAQQAAPNQMDNMAQNHFAQYPQQFQLQQPEQMLCQPNYQAHLQMQPQALRSNQAQFQMPQVQMISQTQEQRRIQFQQDNIDYEQSRANHNKEVLERLSLLSKDLSQLNSRLVGIRFKIERKCIKNGAREERRQSIHKLEIEKNLIFHPKKDRSKSIPTINMNLRLEALKDIKEDLLMRKSKISDEINPEEEQLILPVMEYNYNNMDREIMERPILVPDVAEPKRKRIVPEQPESAINEQQHNSNNVIIEQEEHKSNVVSSHEVEFRVISPKNVAQNEMAPKMKIQYTKKYKTSYAGTLDQILNEQKQEDDEEDQPIQGQEIIHHHSQENQDFINPNIQKQEQIQRIMQKDDVKSKFGQLGVNYNNLRSQSVGGIGALNQSQVNELMQQNFNLRNGEGKNQMPDLYFLDDKGTPICFLINPLFPTLSAADLISEILQIQNNKVHQFQLKKITQIQNLNKLNEQSIQNKDNLELPLPFGQHEAFFETMRNLAIKELDVIYQFRQIQSQFKTEDEMKDYLTKEMNKMFKSDDVRQQIKEFLKVDELLRVLEQQQAINQYRMKMKSMGRVGRLEQVKLRQERNEEEEKVQGKEGVGKPEAESPMQPQNEMPQQVNKPLSQFNFAERQNNVQKSAQKPITTSTKKSAFGNYKMAEAQNQVKVQQAQESQQNGEEPGPKQQAEMKNIMENAHSQLKLSQDSVNSKGSGDINEKRVLKQPNQRKRQQKQ